MNFTSLYYFIVVAEEMNITKAAERLYISQQALSKHIMKLEESLGTPLFTRKPTLELTYPGIRFYEVARQILYTRDRIVAELNDISNHRQSELRIGISQHRGDLLLPRFMPVFTKNHPNIHVRFLQGNKKYMEERLHYDDIDILIGFSPVMVDDVECVDIMQESFDLIVPKSILMSRYPNNYREITSMMRGDANLKIFNNFPCILMSKSNRSRTIFERYASAQGVTINLVMEAESNSSLLYLACNDVGITTFPTSFRPLYSHIFNNPQRPIEAFPIRDPSTYGMLVAAYKRSKKLDSASRDFIDAIVKCAAPFRAAFPESPLLDVLRM